MRNIRPEIRTAAILGSFKNLEADAILIILADKGCVKVANKETNSNVRAYIDLGG